MPACAMAMMRCTRGVGAAEAQRDRGAEREAGDHHLARGRLMREQIVEGDARVIHLAAAVVVPAGAVADAAKVDAQRDEAGRLERLGGVGDDLVVHRPAVERVRVEDQRDALGALGGGPVDRLELAVRGGDEGAADESTSKRTRGRRGRRGTQRSRLSDLCVPLRLAQSACVPRLTTPAAAELLELRLGQPQQLAVRLLAVGGEQRRRARELHRRVGEAHAVGFDDVAADAPDG